MKKRKSIDPFEQSLDENHFKHERNMARELRQSQWWKRRLAKGCCYYCGKPVSPKALTMDHIVPISRGGKSTKGNVVTACKTCNTAKKQLLPMEWEDYLLSVKATSSFEYGSEK